MQRRARRDPADEELHEVPGEDQDHHAGHRQHEVTEEGALPRVAIEVVAAELDDHRSENRDQGEHHGAQPVDPDREAGAPEPEERTHDRRLQGREAGCQPGDDECQHRCHGGGAECDAVASAAVAACDDCGHQQDQRRCQGQQR